MSSTVPSPRDKSLGAFYTESAVTQFLAEWAISSGTDTVLEPSFGGGAFMQAAASRLKALGGSPYQQLSGCELSTDAYEEFRTNRAGSLDLDPQRLLHADFFDLLPSAFKVSSVLGNPPFIRYHLFAGESREKGLTRAREAGVSLSELSSSWAPFLVHCTQFLQPGGRLSMVAPLELLHALYARPVLKYLAEAFSQVSLLTFDRRLFPDLSQDTLLVLAAGFGKGPGALRIVRLSDGRDLANFDALSWSAADEVDVHGLHGGTTRAAIYRLDPATRALYERLAADARVHRLGDIADAGIGYVTGANDFFHLSTTDVTRLGISKQDIVPALRRGRDLNHAGLSLTTGDWNALEASSGKYWLFNPVGELNAAAAAYVHHGEQQQVHTGYKCRTRRPWYKVPWVTTPDLILTVMSGEGPRLVANEARVVSTNTLHVVRLKHRCSPRLISAAARTTLTALSAEIEGHALGGGMLKLEPSEAERLLLPLPEDPDRLNQVWEPIDGLLRSGDRSGADELADQVFLTGYLGLRQSELDSLKAALTELRTWRRER